MSVSGGDYDAGPFFVRYNDYSVVGDKLLPHDHENPHWTECRQGLARVGLEMPNGRIEYHNIGPLDRLIPVPGAALHSIEALQVPCRTHCIFLHRDFHGVVQERFTSPGANQ